MFFPISCTSPFTVAMTMRPWVRAVPPSATSFRFSSSMNGVR